MNGISPAVPGEWDLRMPKLELHVHLEGTLPPERLTAIGRRNRALVDPGAEERLGRMYAPTADLAGFLVRFQTVCGLLRDPQDFHDAALGYAEDLARQGVVYAEVHFSLQVFLRAGLGRRELLEAIHAAFRESRRNRGTELRLILDGVRQWGPDSLRDLLALAEGTRRWGVVGIGMGGDENAFPAEAFAPVFRAARERGWRTTVHAGEAAGPESVRGALEILGVDRIGHGVRAAADPYLLDRLAARGVALDLCPTSQYATGAVPRGGDYPIRRFLERGVPVTVGSDDPALFGTSLIQEIRFLRNRCGLSAGEVLGLQENALAAAFLTGEERRGLDAEFRQRCRAANLPTPGWASDPPPAAGKETTPEAVARPAAERNRSLDNPPGGGIGSVHSE